MAAATKTSLKTEICAVLNIKRSFGFVQDVQNGQSVLQLDWSNGFDLKLENERFTAAESRCRESLNFGNFRLLFCRLRQRKETKCVAHVQHDYFNQSNYCFDAFSFSLPSLLLNLQIWRVMTSRRDVKTNLRIFRPLGTSEAR